MSLQRKWLKKKITKVGIVCNLDSHDLPGSHWVSLFLDLEENNIYFFDSFGSPAPYEIAHFMHKMAAQLEDIHKEPCHIYVNTSRHQFRYSECGMYSIHFIVSMLEGVSFESIVKYGYNDQQMNAQRKQFFNTLDNSALGNKAPSIKSTPS